MTITINYNNYFNYTVKNDYSDHDLYIRNCHYLLENYPKLFIELMKNSLSNKDTTQQFIDYLYTCKQKDINRLFNTLNTSDFNSDLMPYNQSLVSILLNYLPTKVVNYDILAKLALTIPWNTKTIDDLENIIIAVFDNKLTDTTTNYFKSLMFKKYFLNERLFKESNLWKNKRLVNKFYYEISFRDIPEIIKGNDINISGFEFLKSDEDYLQWFKDNRLSLMNRNKSYLKRDNSDMACLFQAITNTKVPKNNQEIKSCFLSVFKQFLGNDYFGTDDDSLIANFNDNQGFFKNHNNLINIFGELPNSIDKYHCTVISYLASLIDIKLINKDTENLVSACQWLLTNSKKELPNDVWFTIKEMCFHAFDQKDGFSQLIPIIEKQLKITESEELLELVYVNQIQSKVPTDFLEWNQLNNFYKTISFFNLTKDQQNNLIKSSNNCLDIKDFWVKSLNSNYMFIHNNKPEILIHPVILKSALIYYHFRQRNKNDIESIRTKHNVLLTYTASAVVNNVIDINEAIQLDAYFEGIKSLGVNQELQISIVNFYYDQIMGQNTMLGLEDIDVGLTL